jgi:hypothetical protein
MSPAFATWRATAVWLALALTPPAVSAAAELVEIPVPPIVAPAQGLPGPDQLPIRTELPPVLVTNDGHLIANAAAWRERRTEIRRTLEYYATGQMPPAPGNVTGRAVTTEVVADGRVTYRLVHLTFGPEASLGLDIGVFTPSEGGPFPAIILQSGPPPGATLLPRLPPGPNQGKGVNVLTVVGPAPNTSAAPVVPTVPPGGFGAQATATALAARYAEVFRRGYALVVMNPNDCAEDTTLRELDGSWSFRRTRFFPAYPGYDWGILAAWAWGVSRVADYLEADAAIDRTKLMVVTGASRYGKSALIAAAFDERLLGAPVVTGGGGIGAYRLAGPRRSETLDLMVTKYPNWFSPRLHAFRGHREKLPFDQHWFLALCAPRPFLALEGNTDTISLPAAVRASFLGAEPVYALLGASGRLGVHYSHHGHAFDAEDWTALLNFTDLHLLGKRDFTFDWFPTEADLDAAASAAATKSQKPTRSH